MIGKNISHYQILEKIGAGGMGVVYKAQDTKLDRNVALKFLPVRLTASHEEISRFEQEAKAISALNHPNIETIHDVDEVDGQKYLVLEYIQGGTLKSKLKQLKSEDKAFSLCEVIDYGIQMAEGLAHAHKRQIIHRDVKTENIMLTEEGKVKLTDFGLAKLRGAVQKTKTGSTLGTAAYMSPEQVRGEEVDCRSDIFSMGVVLYELVTSHLPFQGEYEAALCYATLNENPPPIRSVRADVPLGFEKIIHRCLEKDKEKRYQRAQEIVADLQVVHREISGSATTKTKRSEAPWMVIVVAVLLAAAGIFIFNPKSGPTSAKSQSIAVLPFENLSGSKEDEYFSDGITDDIIAQLSKNTQLKVISRTSIMQYKGTNKNVREIGKDLDVRTVLEGSVRRAGNQVRIVAQLIDAQNEGHLWADTYDKEMTQVFAIQSDVAQRIAVSLKTKLSPSDIARIEKKQTENTEAYQLYLKGRFYWNRRTAPDFQRASGFFNQAIEKDPNYALAFAGLASTYDILPEYGFPAREHYQKAKAAVKKALELDATLAEAHAVLGSILSNYEFDWAGAENEFKRAIELNPNYPTTHHWYSMNLACLRRYDEAIAEAVRAQELDPLSLTINANLGRIFYWVRQLDRAIVQCNKTIELDPNFPWTYHVLGSIYEVQGKFEEAVKAYQKAIVLAGRDPILLSNLGYAYAKTGRKKDALKALDELLAYSRNGYSVSYNIALIYWGVGDKGKTFEWLGKAYEELGPGLINLSADLLWESLRSDARFIALLEKMGFEK